MSKFKLVVNDEKLELVADPNMPLQEAWIEHELSQCGYCQAGQIMSAASLLASNPQPSDSEIEAVPDDFSRSGCRR